MPMLTRVSLSCAVVFLSAAAVRSDDVVGAIWRVERQDDKKIKWEFRAGTKGGVWTVPKEGLPVKIGTWTGNAGKSVVVIDPEDTAKYGKKRTITITQVGKNPPKWQGEVELANGTKHPLTVTLVKD